LNHSAILKNASIPVIYPDNPDAKVILEIYLLLQQKLEREGHPYRVEISRSILTTLLYEVQAIYEKQHLIIKGKQSQETGVECAIPGTCFSSL